MFQSQITSILTGKFQVLSKKLAFWNWINRNLNEDDKCSWMSVTILSVYNAIWFWILNFHHYRYMYGRLLTWILNWKCASDNSNRSDCRISAWKQDIQFHLHHNKYPVLTEFFFSCIKWVYNQAFNLNKTV